MIQSQLCACHHIDDVGCCPKHGKESRCPNILGKHSLFILSNTEATEDEKKMADLKPVVTYTREGDSLKEKSVMAPGMEFEVTLKLNEVFDWKAKENPNLHYKVSSVYLSVCSCVPLLLTPPLVFRLLK